jgi:hypothetical protein
MFFGFGFLIASLLCVHLNSAHAGYKIPYPYTEYEPGEWISPTEQFNTYETLCTGFYIKDISNKNKTKFIGYGDLDFKYTYEENIPSDIVSATST